MIDSVSRDREGVRSGGGSEWWSTKNWKLLKNALKKLGEGGPVVGGGEVGQGGVERRIEVVMEMPKKVGGGRGQGGCERRIEVIVTMHKKDGCV